MQRYLPKGTRKRRKKMRKIKNLFVSMQNALMLKAAGVNEEADVERGDHLLEVLGTIIIAVVILILFKDSIVGIFQSALGQTTTSVNQLFSNVATNTTTP